MLRAIAGLVGLATIGAMAHVSVQSYGGYDAPIVPMILTIAAGLAVAAAVIGHCWRSMRPLAYLLIAACASGEAYTLMATAERTIASRDAKQAPLVAAVVERQKAEKRVGDAISKASSVSETPRLRRAVDGKATADAAVVAKSAERGCAVHCRALLEQQVQEAQREVEAARQEIEQTRARLTREIEVARAALEALPPPVSSSPLSDRLGLPAWALDIAFAVLASFSANGLGAFLVAFAVHGGAKHKEEITLPANEIKDLAPIQVIKEITPEPGPKPVEVPRPEAPAAKREPGKRSAKLEADQFAKANFRPSPTGRVTLAEIRAAYRKWCAEKGQEPLPDKEIGAALNALFSGVGLVRDGFHMVGIELRQEREAA